MKVALTNKQKKFLSKDEILIAEQMVKDFREDNDDPANLLELAAMRKVPEVHWHGDRKVFEITAEICRNDRIWNYYSEDSRDIDIYIHGYFLNELSGFYEVGACLSDIWKIGGKDEEDLVRYMFLMEYPFKKPAHWN